MAIPIDVVAQSGDDGGRAEQCNRQAVDVFELTDGVRVRGSELLRRRDDDFGSEAQDDVEEMAFPGQEEHCDRVGRTVGVVAAHHHARRTQFNRGEIHTHSGGIEHEHETEQRAAQLSSC